MTAHKGPIEGKHFELNGNEQRAGMSSVPEFSPDGWPPQLPWNYDRSELLADALVHAVGVALGLLGGVVLVLHAFHSTQESITAAFLIYAVGLIAMLGISGAYNVYPVCRTKWLLRRHLRLDCSDLHTVPCNHGVREPARGGLVGGDRGERDSGPPDRPHLAGHPQRPALIGRVRRPLLIH